MWRATWKGLLAHKLRMALTSFAIAIGVAFVAGTFVLTDTLTAFFDDVFQEANSGIDVAVRLRARDEIDRSLATIPEAQLDAVWRVPGVEVAVGVVAGYAQLTDRAGDPIGGQGPPTLGFSWMEHERLSPLRLKQGTAPVAPGEIVIDAVSARNHGYGVGDTIKVLLVGPARDFRISGIVGFGPADNLGGATIAAFSLDTAQRVLLGRPGELNEIAVAAEPGTSVAELLAAIRASLPPDLEAVSGRAASDEAAIQARTIVNLLGTAVLFFAGIALLVGSFIVANTFAILIGQRTRELALLRALGATGRQVMRSVLLEALLVGAGSSVVGLGGGVVLGAGLRALVEAAGGGTPLPGASVRVQPRTVVVALVVGIGITLLAALVPARRASRLAPIAAMREPAISDDSAPRRRYVIGAVLVAAGVALLVLPLVFRGGNERLVAMAVGAALAFIGLARVSPLAVRPVAELLGAPLPRLAGVPGTLARNNAGRQPIRTAATAAALMVGLGLVGTVAILGASLRGSIHDAMRASLGADFVVRPLGPPGQGRGVALGPELVERLRSLPAVLNAVSIRTGTLRIDGARTAVARIDPDGVDDVLDLGMREGSADALASPDAVLVQRDEATRRGVRLGDTIHVDMPRSGPVALRVAGTFDRREIVGASFVVSSQVYVQGLGDDRADLILIGMRPGETEDALAAVRAEFPNISILDQGAYTDWLQANVQQIVALVNALLTLAVLIALLGIANTLALSIFERTREIGLLRAVGMTRRQVRRMIRLESVIIAVFGAALGVVVGLVVGVAVVRALSTSDVSRLVVPPVQLLALVLVAGLAGVVSAAFPARRAARVDVLEAIGFE